MPTPQDDAAYISQLLKKASTHADLAVDRIGTVAELISAVNVLIRIVEIQQRQIAALVQANERSSEP
jgi:hypothetical protein